MTRILTHDDTVEYSDAVANFRIGNTLARFSGDFESGLNVCVECCDRHAGGNRLALRAILVEGKLRDYAFEDLGDLSARMANFLTAQRATSSPDFCPARPSSWSRFWEPCDLAQSISRHMTNKMPALILGIARAFAMNARAFAMDKAIKIGVLNNQTGRYVHSGGPGFVLAAQMAVENPGLTNNEMTMHEATIAYGMTETNSVSSAEW